MNKRHLSKRQLERIKRQQDSKSESPELENCLQGLLLIRYGKQAEVETANGEVLRCRFRTHIESAVAGDKVMYQEPGKDDNGVGMIVALQDRRSLLQRPDSFGKLRPVAANLHQLLIVIAPEPEPFTNLIDRYLVVAENAGLEAVLILNKQDLLSPDAELHTWLERYRALGYRVLSLSANAQGENSAAQNTPLLELLKGHTSIFVGQSGVGKSSLINCLLPDINAGVGELSHIAAQGKHTTTASRLYHLPNGGDLIDSPGIREFSLEHFSREDVYRGFREFHEVLGHCRFRDCRHLQEPGCAITALCEAQAIDPARLGSLDYILDNCSD